MANADRFIFQLPSACVGHVSMVDIRTLDGNLDLSATGNPLSLGMIAKLDPGGSNRDITLELESTVPGLYRRIINAADAAESLVVKDDDGTVGTINQNEQGEFFCHPTNGWVLLNITTIALS